jgi:hypothetical protein
MKPIYMIETLLSKIKIAILLSIILEDFFHSQIDSRIYFEELN